MSKKRNKRNNKSFKKRMNKRNQLMKNNQKFNTTDWFNKTFSKVFNHSKNIQLINSISEEGMDCSEVLELYKKRNDLGNELIENILRNKGIIKKLMLFLLQRDEENYNKIFQQYIYLPYNIIGNKHYKKFNEFYEFISQFSLGKLSPTLNLNEEITLFRVMDENEYLNFLIGNGVESPSFTKNPFYLQFMRGNNTYMNIDKKSIFVMFKFKMKDLIIDFQMCGEGEVVIKKGSIPTLVQKYSEYGIEDVKDDFGEGVVDYLPLTTNELNNGFTYMDGLIEKGYSEITKYYTKKGNQWFKISTHKSWMNQYLKDINEVIQVNESESHKHISQIKDELDKVKSLGDKVLNNPLVETTY